MGRLIFDVTKIKDMDAFLKLCPFGALSYEKTEIAVSAACKMCKICVKKGPEGAAIYEEGEVPKVNKKLWKGIAVYVDHDGDEIHPVTLELIGKARELADKIGQKVYCIFIGSNIMESAKELLHYDVDEVFVYDAPELEHYIPEVYASVFEIFIKNVKPCSILVGATATGREIAPRIAARFKTGLTADCTILDITDETDLIQIRPAFGGNIMAQIATPNNRPQLATVRYKVMNAPQRCDEEKGKITICNIEGVSLETKTQIIEMQPKEKIKTIENAEIIVAAGRGVKTKEDLALIRELADALGGEVACTRPLVEAGWMDGKCQIGLSGRTVRPKLIITCGVSGAVQFTAGMNNSDYIFAINKDEKAPIFKTANYGIVGDIYEVISKLIEKIREGK